MSVDDKEMTATFRIANTTAGTDALEEAMTGLRDGFSIELAVDNYEMQKQLEFDLQRFDQQFDKIQGATTTSVLKSGVALEGGTGLRLLRANAVEAQLQKNIMEYNSKVGQAKKMEEANFYRIQGQIARQQARSAQLSTLFSTGTSLLTMGGGFKGAGSFDGASSMAQWQSNPTGYSGSF